MQEARFVWAIDKKGDLSHIEVDDIVGMDGRVKPQSPLIIGGAEVPGVRTKSIKVNR